MLETRKRKVPEGFRKTFRKDFFPMPQEGSGKFQEGGAEGVLHKFHLKRTEHKIIIKKRKAKERKKKRRTAQNRKEH